MITLVGVGHVFDIKEQVRGMILEGAPSVVAVELDRERYAALNQGGAKNDKAPLFYKLAAKFQERIASEYGTKAGDEMLSAINSAREINARVALIDMDIARTMYEMRTSITYEEKVKLVVAVISSLFIRKKRVEKELAKFEEHDAEYLDELGKVLPNVKRVLIDKRNEYMANAIRALDTQHGSVMAFVGDGHIPGLTKLLSEAEPKIIRLSEVRKWEPAGEEKGNASSDFSITYHVEN
ncbi:MAG: TraB/GumN family protein [Thermoplasmata archaeon]|nr:TraB/GumN family protein [Thermoplasmata archaeon]